MEVAEQEAMMTVPERHAREDDIRVLIDDLDDAHDTIVEAVIDSFGTVKVMANKGGRISLSEADAWHITEAIKRAADRLYKLAR
jgi:hypothetical protein